MPAMILTLGLWTPWTASAQVEWEKLPDMPVEKWGPGTVVLDDRLYLFGGYTEGVKSSASGRAMRRKLVVSRVP